MNINFITNQDLGETSGGWSGINSNIYRQLSKSFNINYVGPVNPPFNFLEKLISKLKRFLGLRSRFSFFSENRLNTIKNRVEQEKEISDYDFYFGQTPWVNCCSKVPYGVYMDADFKTYLNIFSTPNKFSLKDVNRIAKKEALWLQKAQHIFVGSEWAWQEMLKSYKLEDQQKVIVHTGGNIGLPKNDSYKGGFNLVFISLNFEKKGGFICVDAFSKVKEKFPEVTLSIIGEKPPNNILEIEGVVYEGLLRKTNEQELNKFKNILSKAFLLIHPTKMDTMGAVLIEAGYFGCPSIAPKSFGIPELVLNNKTGYVIDLPIDYNNIAIKIEELIQEKDIYSNMRKMSWDYTRAQLTWENIGMKIESKIKETTSYD